jgi:hypothetical protein
MYPTGTCVPPLVRSRACKTVSRRAGCSTTQVRVKLRICAAACSRGAPRPLTWSCSNLRSIASALFALRKNRNISPAKRNHGFGEFLSVCGLCRGILHSALRRTAIEIAQMIESLPHFLRRRCFAHWPGQNFTCVMQQSQQRCRAIGYGLNGSFGQGRPNDARRRCERQCGGGDHHPSGGTRTFGCHVDTRGDTPAPGQPSRSTCDCQSRIRQRPPRRPVSSCNSGLRPSRREGAGAAGACRGGWRCPGRHRQRNMRLGWYRPVVAGPCDRRQAWRNATIHLSLS